MQLRRGVYGLDPHSDVAHAAKHGGKVTCISALRNAGVFILKPEVRLHIDIGRDGRSHDHPDCPCHVHRRELRTGLGVASIGHALVQASRCLPPEEFFVAYESAWHLGLLSRTTRLWIRRQLPAAKRYLIDIARGDAESGLESVLRLRLHWLGLTLQSQVFIPGIGRVDFLVDQVIIEVDGRLGHADPIGRHKDLVRDIEAARRGYRVIRLDYSLVIFDWPRAESAILTTLGLASLTTSHELV